MDDIPDFDFDGMLEEDKKKEEKKPVLTSRLMERAKQRKTLSLVLQWERYL